MVAPAAEPPAPSMAATPAPAAAEAESAKPADTGTYTVRSRDTLSRIARKLGLKQSDLASWNGITDPNQLRVGQKLKLSATGG